MEEAPDSLVGSTLAGYVVRERLGSGGSATVYRAESTTHTSIVRAIKIIRKDQRSKFGKRFIEEARLLEKLVHPNIVRFYHATEAKGHLVMALELLEGATLRKLLDAWRVKGELPPLDTIVDIMCGAVEGVAFAHAFVEVVVHRDLKPDNLFVTTEGATKVLDFGIARALDDAEREEITTTGAAAIGTAAYLPPELWGGNELPTPASDVYALGITLFEAVAGKHPFQELGNPKKNPAAYMKAHLMDEVKPLRQVRPDVPESLEKVVTKATAKEPKVRYDSAKEFGEALRTVQAELKAQKDRPKPPAVEPSEPLGPGIKTTVPLPKAPKKVFKLPEAVAPEERSGFPRLLVAYAAGAIALGVAIAAMYWFTKPEEKPPARPSASSSSTSPVPSASVIPAVLTSANAPAPRCPANMVPIPKGTFKMGSYDGRADEKPVHDENVEAFCMDETEVTVEAYVACKDCPAPGIGSNCNVGNKDRENHPINCVDWNAADTYCKKNDKRLPTEAEWEYAARGTDGRKYPWGIDQPGNQLCWQRGTPFSTCAVRSFFEDKSVYKVLDMAGNVSEWTDSVYSTNYEKESTRDNNYRVIRGGAWHVDRDANDHASYVRAANRGRLTPTRPVDFVGFRCASTPR